MKAFDQFKREDKSFWFFIRFISERLGYSERGADKVKSYTFDEIEQLCLSENINASADLINQAVSYCDKRADLLNNFIEPNLMDADEAEEIFLSLYSTVWAIQTVSYIISFSYQKFFQ